MNTRAMGREAEEAAAAYLAGKGYSVIERNYYGDRCEIDIIAREGGTLVFAEVKSSNSEIPPETMVDSAKIEAIVRAAEVYLSQSDLPVAECRFDIIALRKDGEYWLINHIQDAFRPA